MYENVNKLPSLPKHRIRRTVCLPVTYASYSVVVTSITAMRLITPELADTTRTSVSSLPIPPSLYTPHPRRCMLMCSQTRANRDNISVGRGGVGCRLVVQRCGLVVQRCGLVVQCCELVVQRCMVWCSVVDLWCSVVDLWCSVVWCGAALWTCSSVL